MSSNSDVEGIVGLRPYPHAAEADLQPPAPVETVPAAQSDVGHSMAPAVLVVHPGSYVPAEAVDTPVAETQLGWATPESTRARDRTRARRPWVGGLAVGVVGVIAAGTLGYLAYSTAVQRDVALRYAASTGATLISMEGTLASTKQALDASTATASYASIYVADTGRVQIDYQKLLACTTFGSCRTAAQAALGHLQAFQSDRSAVVVPPALAGSDAMLRDALSAAIAADQELISGMDSGNFNKFKDGLHKLNAAMLSIAKAEAVLGANLE